MEQLKLFEDHIKQEVFEFGYKDKSLKYTPHYPFVRLDENNYVTYKKPFTYVFQERFEDRKQAEKRYREILKELTPREDKISYLRKANKEIEIPEVVFYDGIYAEVDYKKARESIGR